MQVAGIRPIAFSADSDLCPGRNDSKRLGVFPGYHCHSIPRLVDEFEPNVITVVERDEKSHSSVFKKLDEIELKDDKAR